MGLLVAAVVGVSVGVLARRVFRDDQTLSWARTMALSLLGAFLGRAAELLITFEGGGLEFAPSGVMWATVGALAVVAFATVAESRVRARAAYTAVAVPARFFVPARLVPMSP
ncbi:MAG: hypothetical protein JNG84_14555 [Archangium sp.]|nr:hypothetical protein [Archangium sp.]